MPVRSVIGDVTFPRTELVAAPVYALSREAIRPTIVANQPLQGVLEQLGSYGAAGVETDPEYPNGRSGLIPQHEVRFAHLGR